MGRLRMGGARGGATGGRGDLTSERRGRRPPRRHATGLPWRQDLRTSAQSHGEPCICVLLTPPCAYCRSSTTRSALTPERCAWCRAPHPHPSRFVRALPSVLAANTWALRGLPLLPAGAPTWSRCTAASAKGGRHPNRTTRRSAAATATTGCSSTGRSCPTCRATSVVRSQGTSSPSICARASLYRVGKPARFG